MVKNKSPIEHLVVLMLENRAYDHMLGYFDAGEHLSGKEYNPVDPLEASSEKVYVSDASGYITEPNPLHDAVSVEKQEFGDTGKIVPRAPMNGFVKMQIENAKGDVAVGKKIMQSFDPHKIPALTTLASEFVLCDHWHASVPGPTMPNRFFAHAATSDGVCTEDVTHLYSMRTIFDSLSEKGISWNVYYGDIPQCIILEHQTERFSQFKMFHRFFEDLDKGALPSYSFIEPRFVDFLNWKATDQHPPHDVRLGEYLIAEVYEALRLSSYWDKLMLLVVYDEHGGLYDHVPPPDAPNPDGKVSTNPPFDFTRLGVRVPAIIVSPWVAKGAVDSTLYEHASIPATLRELFGLPGSLTRRDAAANTFERNLSQAKPRGDTPAMLPVPGEPGVIKRLRELLHMDAHEQAQLGKLALEKESHAPLTLFQQSLVELADRLNKDSNAGVPAQAGKIDREHDAAIHIHTSLQHYLSGGK